MHHSKNTGSKVDNFQITHGETDVAQTDALMHGMAQLFSQISQKCDNKKISHYDDVLCQLSNMVSDDSLAQVAHMLAPLERAPSNIVIDLARRNIEIAGPLLEQSTVLTDENLAHIAAHHSEDHRVSIARRAHLVAPVTQAIIQHSQGPSAIQIAKNKGAEFKLETYKMLLRKAKQNTHLADALKSRGDVVFVDQPIQMRQTPLPRPTKARFNQVQWRIAWGRVQAMNHRGEVSLNALLYAAAQGAGHQAAALFAKLNFVPPEIVNQWLSEGYAHAFCIVAKAKNIQSRDFALMMSQLPFETPLTQDQLEKICIDYDELDIEETRYLFSVWHAKIMKGSTAQKRVA